MMRYEEVYRRSIEDPAAFWGEIAEELHWFRKWDQVLDDSTAPFYRWFVGGETNLCYNAVDRHAQSRYTNADSWVDIRVRAPSE